MASVMGETAASAPAATAVANAMREEEVETMQRLIQGVQEDMMVALLETVQSAAAVCTQICVQRLSSLHKEMISVVKEAEAQRAGGVEGLSEAEVANRTKLSNLGGKIGRYTFEDDESDGAEEQGADAGPSLEGIYGDADWNRCRPSRPRKRHFHVSIAEEYWTRGVTRTLLASLRRLAGKYDDLVITPVPGACEIVAKGDYWSVEAAKPELAKLVMEFFPFAGLPESLRVDGVREPVRLDPADGKTYTPKELWEKYAHECSQAEVWGYWEAEMRAVESPSEGAGGKTSGEPAGPGVPREAASQDEKDDASSRVSDAPAPARSRTRKQAAARLLSRGLRDAIGPSEAGAPPPAIGGPPPVGEFRVSLDKEFWSPSLMRKLLPELQRIGEKFVNLRVAPIMGKHEVFAKGDLRSIEAAKPRLAEVIREHFPFADLPPSLQVEGVPPPEARVDPQDGKSYTLKAFREKYRSHYSDDDILSWWEAQLWPRGSEFSH